MKAQLITLYDSRNLNTMVKVQTTNNKQTHTPQKTKQKNYQGNYRRPSQKPKS